MKILHLNHADIGGAGIAAARVNQALLDAGIDSSMLVCRKHGDASFVKELPACEAFLSRVRTSLVYRGMALLGLNQAGTRSVNVMPSGIDRRIRSIKPDVLHLHWVNNETLSIRELAKLGIPVVWTLHDMWSFCGAENYTEDSRYVTGYQRSEFSVQSSETKGPCIKSLMSRFDLDRWVFRRKQKHWKNWAPHIVTCSNWLASCARQSVLLKDLPINVIPNCLDLNVFKPIKRDVVRKRFNLPLNKKLILFGAYIPSDHRKGGDLLEAALSGADRNDLQDIELVVFGAAEGRQIAGLPTHWLGSFSDENDLAQLYNAVDLFVAPSRQDNLPNTCVEALACGIPVVAFDIGGLGDIIKHQSTGFLAKPFEVDDLLAGIMWVLGQDEDGAARLRQQSREKAERQFSMPDVAAQYLAIYKEILRA